MAEDGQEDYATRDQKGAGIDLVELQIQVLP
jgi:hypothetical protein